MEELCEQSKTIVCAEPTGVPHGKVTIGRGLNKTEYVRRTLKVHTTYKGKIDTETIEILIPTEFSWDCPRIPSFTTGKKYLFFLKGQRRDKSYVRIDIDNIFAERTWDEGKEQKVIEELQFLADPDRFKKPGDNLTYTIPANAEEKEVELTEYQQKHDFSKRCEYWLDGERVGERAWRGDGKLAYEEPFKDGMRHGLFRGWHPDGAPFSERPYRKDRLHGVLKQWDQRGEVTLSYWMRGDYVSKNQYRKACETNKTLPLIKE